MLVEEQKQKILSPLSSSKSLLLRTSTYISEKVIDWHQTIMIKSIGKNKAFVSKSHLSTLLLKVLVQKTLKKSHKSLPFTIRTSLGQKDLLYLQNEENLFKSGFRTNIFKSCFWNWCRLYWEINLLLFTGRPLRGPGLPARIIQCLEKFLRALKMKFFSTIPIWRKISTPC